MPRKSDGYFAAAAADDGGSAGSPATPNEAPAAQDAQAKAPPKSDQDAKDAPDDRDDKDAGGPDEAFLASTHHETGGLPAVTLAVFAATHSLKPDQMAGFVHFAKREHHGRRTMPEWQALLVQFNQREIR